jgi:hypothetical protein
MFAEDYKQLEMTAGIERLGAALMNPNPDFANWLEILWHALSEEDLTKRNEMLQDANTFLERIHPQTQSASEQPRD